MSDLTTITVIMPNLNHVELIERALCSVIDQNYTDLELIVIDGGSNDGSTSIIRQYQADIHYHTQFPFETVTQAINEGLKHATGDLVTILHSNDLMLPYALAEIAEFMMTRPEDEWAVACSNKIGPNDEPRGRLTPTPLVSLHDTVNNLAFSLPSPAIIYRTHLIKQQGGFNEKCRYAYHHEMACRLLAQQRRPAIMSAITTAVRNNIEIFDQQEIIARNFELVEITEQYAEQLPLPQKYAIWHECHQKRQIFTLAEAEMKISQARKMLWQHVLKRPAWLANESFRNTLLNGVDLNRPYGPPPKQAA